MKLKVLKDSLIYLEAYCARIEADIHRCSKERSQHKGNDIIEQMSVVA